MPQVPDQNKPGLRESNRARTRSQIVEAAAALTRESGNADFTMPEVARRSGVSLRTLYRYFPHRQDLVNGLASVSDQSQILPPPESIDDLERWLQTAWRNLLAEEALIRAQHTGSAGVALRRARIGHHRTAIADVLTNICPGLPPAELDDVVDLALLVTSSTALLEFVDVLDVDVDRAARIASRAVAVHLERHI